MCQWHTEWKGGGGGWKQKCIDWWSVCRGVILATSAQRIVRSLYDIRIGHRYIEYVTLSFVACSPVVRVIGYVWRLANEPRNSESHTRYIGVLFWCYRLVIMNNVQEEKGLKWVFFFCLHTSLASPLNFSREASGKSDGCGPSHGCYKHGRKTSL